MGFRAAGGGCFFFVVGSDKDELDFEKAVDSLRTRFRGECTPFSIVEEKELRELERDRFVVLLLALLVVLPWELLITLLLILSDFFDVLELDLGLPMIPKENRRFMSLGRNGSMSCVDVSSMLFVAGGAESGFNGFCGTRCWKKAKSGKVRRTSLSICSKVVLSWIKVAHFDPGVEFKG